MDKYELASELEALFYHNFSMKVVGDYFVTKDNMYLISEVMEEVARIQNSRRG